MQEPKYVEKITLATELDKKVAFAEATVSGITIKGITVWRSGNGKLQVFFPSHRLGHFWVDSVDLPADLRSEIEAEVITSYRTRKSEQDAESRKSSKPETTTLA